MKKKVRLDKDSKKLTITASNKEKALNSNEVCVSVRK